MKKKNENNKYDKYDPMNKSGFNLKLSRQLKTLSKTTPGAQHEGNNFAIN